MAQDVRKTLLGRCYDFETVKQLGSDVVLTCRRRLLLYQKEWSAYGR